MYLVDVVIINDFMAMLFLYIVRNKYVRNIVRSIWIRIYEYMEIWMLYGCGYMDMQTDILIFGDLDIWIFVFAICGYVDILICVYIYLYTYIYIYV